MPDKPLKVTAAEDGMVLLDFLVDRLSLSRRRAKALLDRRDVFVSGRRVWMARHRMKAGDSVQIIAEEIVAPHNDALRLIYRDDDVIIVDKPRGHVVVGPHGLEIKLREQLGVSGLCAVHRLDRDTTGCLLFALKPEILPRLIASFRERAVIKIYDALVYGRISFAKRTLRMPLDGQSAVTHVRCLRAAMNASHVEIQIDTGRTHQIRRHLAAIGNPVAGDKHYNAGNICPPALRDITRQMLHARILQLPHPCRDAMIRATAPLPDDFLACMQRCGVTEKIKTKRKLLTPLI